MVVICFSGHLSEFLHLFPFHGLRIGKYPEIKFPFMVFLINTYVTVMCEAMAKESDAVAAAMFAGLAKVRSLDIASWCRCPTSSLPLNH